MKRLPLLLLTIIYLFSSLGVSAKSMYCMGVLRSTQLNYITTQPKKADCKMAARMKNCCKTKKQLLKVKDNQEHPTVMTFLAKLFPVLFNLTTTTEPVCTAQLSPTASYYTHAPPPLRGTPAYVLNCNFRI